jgi:hypothetical protein
MTALPPSPFLTESPASVETQSSVSTAVEASAPLRVPQPAGAEAATIPDEISHINEIFHHARRLTVESYRRAVIDHGCLEAVATAIETWQAEQDPLPLFLRGEA